MVVIDAPHAFLGAAPEKREGRERREHHIRTSGDDLGDSFLQITDSNERRRRLHKDQDVDLLASLLQH